MATVGTLLAVVALIIMPKRTTYRAKPKLGPIHLIQSQYGYVPSPLYRSRVKKRQRSGEIPCFNCGSSINPGDFYISHYRPLIALCHRCIEGSALLVGDNPWPGLEAAMSKETSRESDPNPSPDVLRAREGGVSARESRVRDDLATRLASQGWRCAYRCHEAEYGRPILPGEGIAIGWDGESIIHTECAQIGVAPTKDNPWAKEIANGG